MTRTQTRTQHATRTPTNTQQATRTPTKTRTSTPSQAVTKSYSSNLRQALIVPSYWYPCSGVGCSWTELLTTCAGCAEVTTAIINPNSGSGSQRDLEYVAQVGQGYIVERTVAMIYILFRPLVLTQRGLRFSVMWPRRMAVSQSQRSSRTWQTMSRGTGSTASSLTR